MTKEEHDILIENNIMLKQIVAYINSNNQNDIKDFAMNIIANIISNKNSN